MSLRVFRVPEAEAEQIQAYAAALDVRSAAKQVMDALFASLSMTFDLNENHHEN